jgi:RND family efflux transporter MFP subunit
MKYIKNKFTLIGIIVLALLFISSRYFLKTNSETIFQVALGDLEQTITISGKIIPAKEVDLSFEISGKINEVSVDIGDEVKAGQILAKIDSSEINNEILESQASLDGELIRLNELTSDTLSENQLKNKKVELLSILKKTYITADDTIRNKIDLLIEDPNSRFPEFTKSLSDYFLRQDISELRYELGVSLDDWSVYNNKLSAENIDFEDIDYNVIQLRKVENLLEKISQGSVDFSSNSAVTQLQIDSYINTISNSRTTIAALSVEINQASESFRSLRASLPIQQSKVRNAEANLDKLLSRIDKYVLTAPFDGVITDSHIEVGEISELGKTALSIFGNAGLEIETFIPEVLVAGVNIGDGGKAKLDAFGDLQSFDVFVVHVDPSETEKDGLTTYRTLVDFATDNVGIKPGMTAEVDIVKNKIENVLIIPTHLVMENQEGLFVLVLEADNTLERKVELGVLDGRGNVEVKKGLNEGDLVVVPKQK